MERIWFVGLDGSEESKLALDWAIGTAAMHGDVVQPVVTWHVTIPLALGAGRRPIDVDRAGLEATAAVVGRHAMCGVPDAPVEVRDPMIVEGHPATVLLDVSEATHPIVVGRRGVSALRHRILGSTSHDLVVHARAPVVVVPHAPATTGPRHVVVGFDGSGAAEAALRWAIETAGEETTIEAVAAMDVVPWLQPEAVMYRHAGDVEVERARLESALDRIDTGRRVEHTIVLRGPHQVLAESFDRADLLVVGPRGRGAVSRVVLGSITSWLLNTAPCPVAVVPS